MHSLLRSTDDGGTGGERCNFSMAAGEVSFHSRIESTSIFRYCVFAKQIQVASQADYNFAMTAQYAALPSLKTIDAQAL
jgi:hypothetical protein